MSHILAYAGSDPGQVARALSPALEEFEEISAQHGWGLGYEQEGQILLRKNPQGTRRICLARLGAELRTRAFIGLVNPEKTSSSGRPENIQPFRWRSWLFGVSGAFPPLAEHHPTKLNTIPDFLRRNIQGDTGPELFFHLVLARLKEEGIHLQGLVVPPEATMEALRHVWLEVEALTGQALSLSLALTDGRNLFCINGGAGLRAYRITSLEEMPSGERRQAVLRARGRVQVHAVVVAEGSAEPDTRWESLPKRVVWTVETDGTLRQSPLDR